MKMSEIKKGDHLVFINKYKFFTLIEICISDPFEHTQQEHKIKTRRVFDSNTSFGSSVGRGQTYCINSVNNIVSYNESSWKLKIIRC